LVSAVLVGGVVLVALLHPHEARELWRNVARVPPATLAAALLLVLGQLSFQTLRLWAIMPADVAVGLPRTAYAFAVGEWFNILTPARAGDALKVWLLHRAPGPPMSVPKATGAVLADKVVDVGSLVLVCSVTGLVGLLRAGAQARLPGAPTAIATAALVALLVAVVRLAPARWLERVAQLRRELVQGLAALKSPLKLLGSLCFSLGAWGAELAALSILCAALSFPLAPPRLVLALAVLNLSISVPVAVANLGVYEAVLAFGLSRSGVALPAAVAIATLHHALELLAMNLAAGALTLWVALRTRALGLSDREASVPREG
jgi:uncharacterized membrane protein YbhN (UPF0104 family)